MSFIVYSVFYPCCEILGERDKGKDGRGDISASFHPLEAGAWPLLASNERAALNYNPFCEIPQNSRSRLNGRKSFQLEAFNKLALCGVETQLPSLYFLRVFSNRSRFLRETRAIFVT